MDTSRWRKTTSNARCQLLFPIVIFMFMVVLLSCGKSSCIDSVSAVARKTECCTMENEEILKETVVWSRERRRLSGLGSSPPRCILRCGKCSPCKPVHVTVPPSTPVTTEYYPEAWRCKCGNKLYMP